MTEEFWVWMEKEKLAKKTNNGILFYDIEGNEILIPNPKISMIFGYLMDYLSVLNVKAGLNVLMSIRGSENMYQTIIQRIHLAEARCKQKDGNKQFFVDII